MQFWPSNWNWHILHHDAMNQFAQDHPRFSPLLCPVQDLIDSDKLLEEEDFSKPDPSTLRGKEITILFFCTENFNSNHLKRFSKNTETGFNFK